MQPICKAVNLTKTVVLFPFVKLGNSAHRKSMMYVAKQESDFLARVEGHKAAGTDLATEVTHNFVADQWRLFPYRIVKCREEWDYFKTESWKTYFNPLKWDVKGMIVETKFLIHVLAFYIFAVMMGRNSIFPLVEPDSPFVEGLKYVNPNTNR